MPFTLREEQALRALDSEVQKRRSGLEERMRQRDVENAQVTLQRVHSHDSAMCIIKRDNSFGYNITGNTAYHFISVF
jgi:hypothetical protein